MVTSNHYDGRANLVPFQSAEEARQRGRAGGIASGVARRRKRTMAELAHQMLSAPLKDADRAKLKALAPGLDDEDATIAAVAVSKQVQKAVKGDLRAFQMLTEMDDRAAASEAAVPEYRMDPLDLTTDFIEPYRTVRAVMEGRDTVTREIVSKGGRGGAKSSFWAEVAFEVMKTVPGANVVYNRRYKNDLRSTVFSQFCKVIARHGDADNWTVTQTPRECVYKPTGCRVYFFGADNPLQNKSFAPEVGYVALLIHEECDEMAGMEQMDDAESTFLRSNGCEGARSLSVKVFNPPASKSNFMNAYAREMEGQPHVLVCDACYKNVPREWLGERFFERAEWFRANRPEVYANKFLGEVTGTGGELFGNVRRVSLTDGQVAGMEQAGIVYQGIDWGFEHPQVFIRVAYDPETDTVTPLFEKYGRRCKLPTFCKGINRFKHMETICDSAEPDRIADIRDMGWNAVGAVKRWRGGGRDYSWEWLRGVREIAVDPERTPRLLRELETLEFERLRDGTYSSRYPDLGEDGVMATIYALNRVIAAAKYEDAYDDEEL